jgi:predicted enzyme related to lactoylglutathione lyase
MEVDKFEHGVPGWVDLGTPDLDAGRAFYSALFGWDIPPGPEEAGGYSVAMMRGRATAGFGPAMNPGPPVWSTYVIVDSADDIATKVADAGGMTFVEPMDVLDAGRMAVFADPRGAVFSVWQPNQMPGAGIVNEPNSYSWSELMTSDVEASKQFYGAVFGWGAETHEGASTSGGGYTEWQVAGRSVGGMLARPPMMPAEVPDLWAVYFSVANLDAAMTKVKELGGAVHMGPMTVAPGTFAMVSDPQGAQFVLIELSPERSAG